MRPLLIVLHIIAGIVFLYGASVVKSGASLPVYTDPRAPEELSRNLQDLPRDQRFQQWYEQLPNFETPHKRLTDLGRGLMAVGLGISISSLFLHLLSKANPKRLGLWIGVYWILLWGIKFPLSMRYYSVRQMRFDYPVWGDSIAIGVFQDCFAWAVGLVVSSILLAILMIRNPFTSRVALGKPEGGWEWLRASILWLWLILLAACALEAIPDGDEGMTLSCTGAIPVILIALSAREQRNNKMSLLMPDPQIVSAGTTDSTPTQQSDNSPG